MLKFIGKSFKRELVAGFIIVSLIPLLIICTLLVQTFKVTFSDEQERKVNEIQSEILLAVSDVFEQLSNSADKIQDNRKIIAYLNSTDNWERKQVYGELYANTEAIRDIAKINIYNEEGICQYTTGNEPVEESLSLNWGILYKALNNPNQISYLEYKKYGNDNVNDTLLIAAKPIVDQGAIIGFTVFEMNDEHFYRLFKGLYNSHDGIAVLSHYWDEIYANEVALKENVTVQIRERLFQNERLEDSINGYSPYLFEVQDTGINIVFLKAELLNDSNFKSMYQIISIFAFMSLLLSLGVTRVLSNHLMEPIKQLSSAMNQTEAGNLDTRISEVREDEFGILYRDFNAMTHKLKIFTEQKVQDQKDLNEANIAMMHAQLNPHFLYNTLDSIKWSGKINHVPEVSLLATSLAKILRMSISPDKFISLKDELSFVESYMKIQQIRFDNRFQYEFDIPKELEDLLVPKLIIQPIVENAVIHGLSEVSEGKIFIRCYTIEDDLEIEVVDNGSGIDENILKILQSTNEDAMKGHIGLLNVNRILRLSYGEDYGLKACRLEASGTRVVLRMPIVKGGDYV